ncbi:SDR family NAD(P)-dependent oxidoreductase [Microbaculum sp. FT89]|uniref:SDR family NAD(P)-dependent oxidoreductase n=1 Tax=Microbaculum sp. FT89 TaxID=3447298 RepID=UPI003F5359C0
MKDNPFSLQGQRIVVTGGLGGFGFATAQAALGMGARVFLLDREERPEAMARLDAYGDQVSFHACDVCDRQGVERLAAEIGPVDGLVVNAGVLPFDDWEAPDWDSAFDRVIDVNLRGAINTARAWFGSMCEAGQGRIVFVGSASGKMGGLQAGPHYVGSKGGIHAVTKWLALKGARHGVRVNAIAPGSADTGLLDGQPFASDKVPLGRMATAEEIAWPIVFLLGEASNYMCGSILDVNGGLYMD